MDEKFKVSMDQAIPMAIAWSFTFLVALSACDGPESSQTTPSSAQETCAVAVLSSDYAVSALSLLTDDGEPCIDPLLTSGSAPVGLVTALSGDVVLASATGGSSPIVLIDRFPNATLTFISDAPYKVASQTSVSTGFPSNPQDLVRLSDGRYYVTRYEANASPSDAPDDFDDGADVLILAEDGNTLLGRVPLGMPSDPSYNPCPSSLVEQGEVVWVSLANLSRDFSTGRDGEVLLIDTQTDEVLLRHEIKGLANCVGLQGSADGLGVWVSCSGVFADGPDLQLTRSGLVRLGFDGVEVVEQARLLATEFSQSPLSPNMAVVGDNHVVISTYGSLTPPETADRLFVLDVAEGRVEEVETNATPFGLGGILWRQARSELWVCDGDPTRPAIRRFRFDDGVFEPLQQVFDSTVNGLPPRQLLELD